MTLPNTVTPAVVLDEAQIRLALGTILSSATFADVPRLSRFLDYVVSETLAGRGSRLKGFVIACDVFDKDDPSDAQTTTIVRVEAGRLRRRLADYYASEGSEDAVRIHIPKGGYTPIFDKPGDAGSETAALQPARQKGAQQEQNAPLVKFRERAFYAFAMSLCGALLYALAMFTWQDSNRVIADSQVFEWPTLAVLPLEPYDQLQAESSGLGMEIAESLVAVLSRRPDLHVMALSSTDYYRSEVNSVKDIAEDLQVSHVLQGGFSSRSGELRVTMVLHDARSGYAIWSDSFSQEMGDNPGAIANRILTGLASELGLQQPQSAISLPGYAANTYALFGQARDLTHPPSNKLRVGLALGIFGELIDKFPDFAGGYAGAAYAHAAMVWWGNSASPVAEAEQVQALATRAIELDSGVGLAYVALGMLEMHRGEHRAGINLLETAVDVQPSNSLALSVLAIYKIWGGEPDGAVELIQQAIQLDPLNRRAPYWNILGMVQYHLGDYVASREALLENLRRGGPQSPVLRLYLPAALARTGRPEAAADMVAEAKGDPSIIGAQHWIYRNFKDKQEFERLLSVLETLGLQRSAALTEN
jgi:adenylate cyclase